MTEVPEVSLSVAGYEILSVEAGRLALDGGAMFGIIPRALWERRIRPDARNRIVLSMRCMLLIGHSRVVLVDCGVGNKEGSKFQDIYDIDLETSSLVSSLQNAGVSPSDVTDVILTHLHFDHVGGATKREGNNVLLTFADATHHVQQRHWNWAHSPPSRESASFLEDNLRPLSESGQLNLIDGPGPLWDGVDLLTVDGHTTGQQLVRVTDTNQTIVFAADLIPTAAHVPPVWNMAYDNYPMTSTDEKTSFLTEAVAGEWKLFLQHDVDHALVGIEQVDGRFRPVV